MRVYELAKQLGITSAELIDRLKKIGIEVKSHSSSIDKDVADKLNAAQNAGSSTKTEQKAKPNTEEKQSADLKTTQTAKKADSPVMVESPKQVIAEVKQDVKQEVKPETKQPAQEAKPVETKKKLDVPQAATVKEFAGLMGKEPTDLIKMLLKLGELVTINQSLSS
ncbi:MAG: translation initiation factor IF-2 N-terminal domain-containing protein, partial [Rubrobacteridae bacterium]|nr:translation initiation factor IF-2 N-terminal domain-containing protein [Rubrobacteridae bacterium]